MEIIENDAVVRKRDIDRTSYDIALFASVENGLIPMYTAQALQKEAYSIAEALREGKTIVYNGMAYRYFTETGETE